MHTLRTYCQLYTFLHLFFSHVDKQYYLCFNICLFQSTSVSTVQTVVYPGSDNSMCQLSLVDRGHIFFRIFHHCVYVYSKIGCLCGWKFALVTLVEFLSTIYLHMLFQIRCLRFWKIALVTFVGFSSTMYLHMIVQICCERNWNIALITFIILHCVPSCQPNCQMSLLLVLFNVHTGRQ